MTRPACDPDAAVAAHNAQLTAFPRSVEAADAGHLDGLIEAAWQRFSKRWVFTTSDDRARSRKWFEFGYREALATSPRTAELRAQGERLDQHNTALVKLSEHVRECHVALRWYAEQVAGCRKIGSAGDPFRAALDHDGGERAKKVLALESDADVRERVAIGIDGSRHIYERNADGSWPTSPTRILPPA